MNCCAEIYEDCRQRPSNPPCSTTAPALKAGHWISANDSSVDRRFDGPTRTGPVLENALWLCTMMQDSQQSLSISADAYVMSLFVAWFPYTKLPQQPMLLYHKWEWTPVPFIDILIIQNFIRHCSRVHSGRHSSPRSEYDEYWDFRPWKQDGWGLGFEGDIPTSVEASW